MLRRHRFCLFNHLLYAIFKCGKNGRISEMNKGKMHFAWVIALACLCNQAAVLGTIANCRGMFFNPICQDLGFGLGELTFYATLYGIASVVAIPIAAKVLPNCNLRLVMGTAGVVMATSQLVQAWFNKLWQWYVVGAVQGICSAFLLTMAISLLVNNWFIEKRGLVFGAVSASSGVMGAIMNSVGAVIIRNSGWRTAYIVLAVILYILLVPLNMFAVRFRPSDMGLKPYGYKEGTEEKGTSSDGLDLSGFTAKQAFRMIAFWLMLIAVAFAAIDSTYNQMLSGLGESFGYSPEAAGTFISITMFGSIFIKILTGQFIDKFGIEKANVFAMGMSFFAFLFLMFGKVDFLVYPAIVFQGATMAINSVIFPVWTRHLFGLKDYTKIYSYVSITSNGLSAIGVTLFGTVIGASSSYIPSVALGLAMMAICIVLNFVCNGMIRKYKATAEG